MTLHDDHWPAMTNQPSQPCPGLNSDLDALLGNPGTAASQDLQETAAFLATLHRLVELPAPRPSAELAAVMAHGLAPRPAAVSRPEAALLLPVRSRWLRRSALAVGLSAGITASLAGGAAASDRLPDGAQDVWVRLVEAITPFEAGDPRSPGATGDSPGSRGPSPATVQRPGSSATTPPVQDGGAAEGTARHGIDASATKPDKTLIGASEKGVASVEDRSASHDREDRDAGASGSVTWDDRDDAGDDQGIDGEGDGEGDSVDDGDGEGDGDREGDGDHEDDGDHDDDGKGEGDDTTGDASDDEPATDGDSEPGTTDPGPHEALPVPETDSTDVTETDG